LVRILPWLSHSEQMLGTVDAIVDGHIKEHHIIDQYVIEHHAIEHVNDNVIIEIYTFKKSK